MVFVDSEELLPGMCLAKNIIIDKSASPITVKSGQKLTDLHISAIRTAKIDGAYIDTASSDVRVISSVDQPIRREAVSELHDIADNFINGINGVQESDIAKLTGTVHDMIINLQLQKDMLVNIAEVQMYDDYTYHHCLSVAIMSIAIGMELGMSGDMLQDIGMAGILHDLGKVAIPTDIINKPGPLTDEEYEVVKQHPVLAAKHLKERDLINDDVYCGIICHHEKLDGSGYPNHLEGEEIHPYAKILAVADVYDALTSNRPYRVPSPPNEAIEYIMGGLDSHFDENAVKAFLRKVAPYPLGSKLKLSNGETAYVIKNYPDQPLRPVVAVIGTDKVYDLSFDMSCMSIVIMEMLDGGGHNRSLINM